MASPSRSLEPITDADLRRLLQIARADLARMFASNQNWRPYRDRPLAIALCQGAALHYIDERNGVKDFDVWTFFARVEGRPYPDAALTRRRKVVDFGASRFGRTPRAPTWMEGRRVDLFARSLDVRPGTDPGEAIRQWLADGRTESARRLAHKAVVELEPMLGRVIWPSSRG
jgi:hypothetical protein